MSKPKLQINIKKIASKERFFLKNFLIFVFIIFSLLSPLATSEAALNKQINYQGKLTNASGVAVTNGTYNIQFKLYTVSTGGTAIWTETRTDPDRVQVTSGLFSVLLGEVNSLSGVDFNQTLYLGVNIGGTAVSPTWDGEMTPRKKLGVVPAAVVAEKAINILGGSAGYIPFQTAADTTSFSSDFFWDNSTKKLGIGTTAPSYKLDIRNGASTDILRLSSSGAAKWVSGFDEQASPVEMFRLGRVNSNLQISTLSSTNINLMPGGLGATAGNVGIGTTAPGAKLTISDELYIDTSTVSFPVISDQGTYRAGVRFDNANTDLKFSATANSGSTWSDYMTIKYGGSVGIGTTGPGTKLDVVGGSIRTDNQLISTIITGTSPLAVTSTTLVSNLNADLLDGQHGSYYQVALTNPVTGTGTTNYLAKFTDTSALGNSLIFDNGTNVGIGTTAPNSKLEITQGTGSASAFRIGRTATRYVDFLTPTGNSLPMTVAVNGNSGSANSFNVHVENSGGYTMGDVEFLQDVFIPTGSVGIGTTAPGEKLHIDGANALVKITDPMTAANSFKAGMSESGGVAYPAIWFNQASPSLSNSSFWANGQNSIFNTPSSPMYFRVANSGYMALSADGLAINTGNNASGTGNGLIVGTGNVGIGTTAPSSKLTVAGDLEFTGAQTIKTTTGDLQIYPASGFIRLGSATGDGGEIRIRSNSVDVAKLGDTGGTNDGGLFLYNSDGTTNNVLIRSNGNSYLNGGRVGIGTTAPSGKFTILDNATTINLGGFDCSTGYAGLGFGTTPNCQNYAFLGNSAGTNTYFNAGTTMYFRIGNVDKMIMLSNGNVGIGTTAPGTKLDVVGGSIRTDNQLISTIATGTSPLAVTSTTLVSNLNADLLDGQHGSYYQVALTNPVTGTGTTNYLAKFTDTSALGNSLIFDNGTNVGIGTTAPGAKLQIVGGIIGSSWISTANNFGFTIKNAANTAYRTALWMDSSNILKVGQDADITALTFGVGSEQMRITSGGNVGIGTTSPGTALEVNGHATIGTMGNFGILNIGHSGDNYSAITVGDSATTASATGIYLRSTANVSGISTAGAPLAFYFGGPGTSEKMRILASGSVGIGTTAPTTRLTLAKTTNSNEVLGFQRNSDAAVSGRIGHWDITGAVASDNFSIWTSGGNPLAFGTNGSEHMRILSTGNVGIGTTSPQYKLDMPIGQKIGSYSDAAHNASIEFYNTTTANMNFQLTNSNGGSYTFSNGNVGIGTTAPTSLLHLGTTFDNDATTPTLSFGDGDTGFYESADDILRVSVAGADRVRFQTIGINAVGASPVALMITETASVTNPVFTFDSDTDTGIGGDGANVLSLIAGGINVLNANSSGNVGIGTTAPGALLHTYKTSGDNNLLVESDASGNNISRLLVKNNQDDTATFGLMSSGGSDWPARSTVISYSANGPLVIAEGTSEMMRIDNSGNVGIGTTAPGQQQENKKSGILMNNTGGRVYNLQLTDDTVLAAGTGGALTFAARYSGTSVTELAGIKGIKSTATTDYNGELGFFTRSNGVDGLTERMRIDESGNVGIGTTAPSGLLNIRGNNPLFRLSNSNASGVESFIQNVWDGTNNYLRFYEGGYGFSMFSNGGASVGSYIDVLPPTGGMIMSGSVGIGTTAPGTKLDVVGGSIRTDNQLISTIITGTSPLAVTSTTLVSNLNADLLDGQHGNYYAPLGNISGTDHYVAKFNGTSALENSLIFDNGTNVGIGTTAPSQKLEIGGNLTLSEAENDYLTLYGVTKNSFITNSYSSIYTSNDGGTYPFTSYGNLIIQPRTSTGASKDIILATGDTTPVARMTIQAGGNVGIGTTSPGYTLHISKAGTGGGLAIERTDASPSLFTLLNSGGMANFAYSGNSFGFNKGVNVGATFSGTYAPSNGMAIEGNVGIGTTNPTDKLMLSGLSSNGITLSGTNPRIYSDGNLIVNAASGLYFQSGGASKLYWDTANWIFNAGNVGIGTTNPGDKLSVNGTTASLHYRIGGTDGTYTGRWIDVSTYLTFDTYNGTNFAGRNLRIAGNDVYFGTGSSATELMRLTAGGGVGIGTTAPASRLDVADTNPILTLTANAGGFSRTSKIDFGATFSATDNSARNAGNISGGLSSTTWDSSYLNFQTRNVSGTLVDAMRITNGGSVGIGTTAPVLKTQIHGIYNLPDTTGVPDNGILRLSQTSGTSVLDMGIGPTGNAWLQSYLSTDATSLNLLLNPNGGNVGIGTTSPGYKLDINGNVNTSGIIYFNNSNRALQLGAGGTGDYLSAYGPFGIKLYDGSGYNEKVTILSSGNVGIGTISPTSKLQLNKTANNTLSLANSDFYFGDETLDVGLIGQQSLTTPYFFSLQVANKAFTYFAPLVLNPSGGNVGIGTTSPGSIGTGITTLDIRGASGGGMYFGTSSLAGYIYGSSNTYIGSSASGFMSFNTNGEKVRITNDGSVGIGTTGPGYALDVNSSTDTQLRLNGNGTTWAGITFTDLNGAEDILYRGSTDGFSIGGGGSSAAGKLHIYGGTAIGSGYNTNDAPTNGLIIEGSVGIGTTAPGAKLHVISNLTDTNTTGVLFAPIIASQNIITTGDAVQIAPTISNLVAGYDATNFTALRIKPVTNGTVQIENNYGLYIEAGTAGNYNYGAYIAGNVGIGTTNPLQKLDVNGSIYIEGGNSLQLRNTANNSTAAIQNTTRLDFQTGGASSMAIGYNGGLSVGSGYVGTDAGAGNMIISGSVGIGTTAPSGKLQVDEYTVGVNGNQTVPSTSSIFTNSGTDALYLGIKNHAYPNRGWAFRPVTNGVNSDLQIYEHGSSGTRMTIQTTGNVGIGTTAPAGKLDVMGSAIGFRSTDWVSGTLGNSLVFNTNLTASPYITLQTYKNGGGAYGDLVFQPNSGNVGIGTTGPLRKLHVEGTGYGQIYTKNSTASEYSGLYMMNDNSKAGVIAMGGSTYTGVAGAANNMLLYTGASDQDIIFASAGTERVRFTGGGNVGIGTTAPDAKFNVYGGTSNFYGVGNRPLGWGNTSALGALTFDGSANPMITAASGDLILATNNTSVEGMRIKATTGNVGIGTTAPTRILSVKGVIGAIDSGNSERFYLNPTTTGTDLALMNSAGAFGIRLDSRTGQNSYINVGNVGIGTTSPGAHLVIGADTNRTYANGTGDVYVAADLEVDGTLYTAGLSPTGSIIPSVNDTYDLGSDALRWKDLYLGAETLHIGTSTSDEGYLSYTTATNVFNMQSTGNIALQPTSGNVGIGTTAPQGTLSVKIGSFREIDFIEENGALTLKSTAPDTSYNIRPFILAGSTLNFRTGATSGTTSTEVMRLSATGGLSLGNAYVATDPGAGNMIITGNVGIGTTAPDNLLHVSTAVAGKGAHIGNAFLGVWNGNTGFAQFGYAGLADTSYALLQQSTGATFLNSASGQSISFRVNNTEYMTLASSGNVGIGTTAIEGKLEVLGGALPLQLTTSDYILGSAGSRTRIGFGAATGNTYSYIQTTDVGGNSASDLVLQKDSGNVGIGTTAPNGKLSIVSAQSTGTGILNLSDNGGANNSYLNVYNNPSAWVVATSKNGTGVIRPIRFAMNDYGDATTGVSLSLETNGNVGIGTTAPGGKLDVSGGYLNVIEAESGSGTLRVGALNGNPGIYANVTGKNLDIGTAQGIYLRTGGAGNNRLNIDSSGNFAVNTSQLYVQQSTGNVGIGTAGPTFKLSVYDSTVGASANRIKIGHNYDLSVAERTTGITMGAVEVSTPAKEFNIDVTSIQDYFNAPSFSIYRGSNASKNDFVINSSGNVGIGTTAPGAKLNILSTLSDTLGEGTITIGQTADATNYWTFRQSSGANFAIDAYYSSAWTNKFFIQRSTGNVGIGTTSPQYKLDIPIGQKIGSYSDATHNASIEFYNTTTANMNFQLTNSNGGSYTFSNGNVGIGVTNPTQALEVSDSLYDVTKIMGNTSNGAGYVGAVLEIESNSDYRGRGVYLSHRDTGDASASEWYMGTPYEGNLFQIGNSAQSASINSDTGPAHKNQAKFVITEAGNIGIGTTAPSKKLDVNGAINSAYGTTGGYWINGIHDVFQQDSGYHFMLGSSDVNAFLGIRAGGSERVSITTSGNVGIGTTAPTVSAWSGVSPATLKLSGSTYSAFVLNSGSSGYQTWVEMQKAGTIYGIAGVESSTPGSFLSDSLANANIYSSIGAYPLQLGTNNAVRMTILSGGNIGIGTTAPLGAWTRDLHIHDTNSGGSAGVTFSQPTKKYSIGVAGTDLRIYDDTASLYRMVIDTNGNVGIGTTAPQYLVHINSADPRIIMTASGSGVTASDGSYWRQNGVNTVFGNQETGDMQFFVDNTGTRGLYIKSGGNVGIGTTIPNWKLDVQGAGADGVVSRMYGDTNYGGIITFTRGASYQWGAGIGGSNSTNGIPTSYFGITEGLTTPRLVIAHTSGNVGIGTTGPARTVHIAAPNILLGNGLGDASGMQYGGNLLVMSTDTAAQDAGGSIGLGGNYSGTSPWTFASLKGARESTGGYGYLALYTENNGYSYERMRINSSGNIGIGTTTPVTKLDVTNTTASEYSALSVNSDGGRGINLYSFGSTYAGVGAFSASSIALATNTNATQLALVNTSTTGYLSFFTNGSAVSRERMRITNDGNVGIGTTAPGEKLDVAGNLQVGTSGGAYITFKNASGVGNYAIARSTGTTNGLIIGDGATLGANVGVGYAISTVLPQTFNVNGTTYMSGNVGIGTTSPANKLDILNSVDSFGVARITNTHAGTSALTGWGAYNDATTGYGVFGIGGTGYTVLSALQDRAFVLAGPNTKGINIYTEGSGSSAPIIFTANDVEAMRIIDGGNVGIGTTAPNQKLEVNGSANLTNLNSDLRWGNRTDLGIYGDNNYSLSMMSPNNLIFHLDANNNNADNTYFSIVKDQSTAGSVTNELFRVMESGNVGIGTTAPGANLEVTRANDSGSIFRVSTVGGNGFDFARSASTGALSIQGNQTGANNIILAPTSGNVGIGTTAPTSGYELDVNGDMILSGSGRSLSVNGDISSTITGTGTNINIRQTSGGTFGKIGSRTSDYAMTIYGASGDPLSLGANDSADMLYIATSGNVGIGTTAPGALLEIVKSGAESNFYITGASNNLYEPSRMAGQKARGTLASPSNVQTGDEIFSFTGRGYADGAYRNMAGFSVYADGTPSSTSAPGRIEFLTVPSGSLAANSRMTINSAGNVGIGTTAPGYPLDIYATDTALNMTVNDTGTNDINTLAVFTRRSTGTAAANFAARFRFDLEDAAGNVEQAGAVGSIWQDPTNGSEDSALFFQTRGPNGSALAERMRINSSGNVGIGTTAPGQLLTLNKTSSYAMEFDSSGVTKAYVGIVATAGDWVTDSGTGDLALRTESGNIVFSTTAGVDLSMRIDGSSNVLVGGSLTANGDICSNTYGCLSGLSDARLKKDVITLDTTLDKVMQLNPITYKWNDIYISDHPDLLGITETKLGFIAQEVDSLFPELVNHNDTSGLLSIDYNKFAPILTKAIQELNIKISNLEKGQIASPTESLGEFASLFFNDVVTKVENGVAYMKSLVVDTLQTKSLTVGTKEVPAGITMYDKATKEPYCVTIENGEMMKNKGECALETVAIEGPSENPSSPESNNTFTPIITLKGDTITTLNIDDPYVEEGALAQDDIDPELAIIISGTVDTSVDGTYTITYYAEDSAGNSATPVTRTVIVGKGSPTTTIIPELESTTPTDSSGATTSTDSTSTSTTSTSETTSTPTSEPTTPTDSASSPETNSTPSTSESTPTNTNS